MRQPDRHFRGHCCRAKPCAFVENQRGPPHSRLSLRSYELNQSMLGANSFLLALVTFTPYSAPVARSACSIPRTATRANKLVPIRNNDAKNGISIFTGDPASLFFFMQILRATIVPEQILFLLSVKLRESGSYIPAGIHLNPTAMKEVSSYRHTPKYRRPEQCGSIVVDATARVVEGLSLIHI